MISYIPDSNEPGQIYDLSYRDLKGKYDEFCGLRDDEFIQRLPEALHFACFVCYFKEVPPILSLSDVGIIHLMAHQLHMPDDPTAKGEFNRMRQAFKDTLKLA